MKKKIYIKKMNAEQSIKAKVKSIAQIKIKNSVFYSVIAVFFIMFVGIEFLIFGKTYSMTTGNKGVIVQTYYSQEYFKNNNNMQMTIKNNNNDNIILKKIIYRNNDCIINNTTCPDYTEVNASNSFIGGQSTTIQSNAADYINLNNVSSFFADNKNVEVGIKYSIEGDDSEYVVTSNTMETESNNSMAINSKNNEFTEEEFVFTANIPDHWTASIYPKAKMYTKLSANNIHMNIDETLDSFNLKYQLKTEWPNAYFVASPFNADVQTANMLGTTNYSNFKEFFSFTTTNITKQSNKGFGYEDMSFDIKGTLKNDSTYTNVTIYPSFYWCLGSKTLNSWNNKRCSGDGQDEFVTEKIPQFKLTVYNKEPLANAINNAIQKQKDKSDSTVYDFNSYIKYNNHIKTAIELYNGRNNYKKCDENGKNCVDSDTNQQEVNYYVNLLNTYEIEKRPSADYSSYNSIISDIDNLNSSWYETTTYNSLMTLYNEKDNYLNYNDLHQYELDNYVNRLKTAFDALILLDADTTNLEAAIATAKTKENETYIVGEESYKLYTEETWQALTSALTVAEKARSYKIDKQVDVDTATTNLEQAISGLEKTLAITTNLEAAIATAESKENTKYPVGEKEYTLYTDETWTSFTTALDAAKDVRNNTIDQQKAVNDATTALNNAMKGLKKRSAVTTDLEAAITTAESKENTPCIVGEKEYTLYTDETWTPFTTARDAAKDVRNNTIDQQKAVDDATNALKTAIEGLTKTPAVTTNLEAAITKAETKENKTYTVGEETYTLYTDETWTPFTTALNAAKDVRNNTIDQQKAVDDATNTLKTAIEGLTKTSAVTTDLEAAITTAESKENTPCIVGEKEYTLYTEDSWNDMIVAKTKAETAKTYKIDQQEAVDAATNALKTAIEGLEKTPAVTTNLEAAIAEANSIENKTYTVGEESYKLYTEDTWNKLTTALAKAETAKTYKIDQQEAVDAATKALKTAIKGLEKNPAVTTNLEAAITTAESKENTPCIVGEKKYTLYTEKTWNDMIVAKTKAEAVKNYKIDQQEAVDEATTALNNAIENLVKTRGVYTNVESIVNHYNKYKDAGYYLNDNIDLENYISAINYNLKIDEQDKINSIADELERKVSSLEYKIADYSNLDKIIADYYNSEDYINNYYDEEDKKSLEKYINSIDRTIVIINQEKVTKIETDLKLKIASLKYLPADYQKINDLVSEINKLNKDNYSNFKDLQKLIDSIIYDKTIKEQNYVDKLYSQLYTSYKSLKTKEPDQESSNNSNSSTEQDNNKKLNYKDLIEYITVNDNKVDMTTDSFKHNVSKYTTEAIIKVGLKNKNYKVTIEGNKKLKSGSNIYKIIIKDNKNKKYTYSLEVIKEDASNYLSNIKISGYEIEFNKKTQSYKIKISEEVEKLNIEAIPEDKDAQVIIEGNDNLKNKSVVTIKVIAADKEERLYKIHIIKELVPAEEIKEEKDSKTIIPYVAVGIVATTIIGIGSYILFIKPKKF